MKRVGLDRRRWVEPIEEFVRQHGNATPRWAIFLTYHVDLEQFARSVLPLLARRGRCFRSVVISDQGTLEQSLRKARTTFPGAVNLHPIRCNRGGVFHPKLILLRAGRHVRACFGSANITDGGMGSNLELWTSTESAEILGGLQHFLLSLIGSPDLAIDAGARRSLRRAISGLAVGETQSVWSSLQESFADRLRRGPERNAASATIVSPMYAGDGGIKAARNAIPAAKVQLYTDLTGSVPRGSTFVYGPPAVADQSNADTAPIPQCLHAKAYVFRDRVGGGALAWTGSANFTAQALTKPVSKGGNVELMVRTRLLKDEADALDVDLKELFTKRKSSANADGRRTSTPPKAIATILACELLGAANGPQLRIHATQRQGHVVLRSDACQVEVQIKDGRGILEGDELRKLLPELDLTAAQVLVLYQLVRGEAVPVVVNVSHVPPDDALGGSGHASIDALLDDLLGRVPVVHVRSESADEQVEDTDGPSDDGCGESDEESRDLKRRLDQVKHQGEIDQLAVKAALLKKLAIRSTAVGAERKSLLGDIVRVLLTATPPHLAPAIRSHFDNIEPSESA